MSNKLHDLKVGYKIWFEGEKQGYIVKACDDRYVICTKPFNPLKTVLYTIVDFKEGIRGRNNLIFNIYDYKKQEDIDQCLKDLNAVNDPIQVSHRYHVELQIVKIKPSNKQQSNPIITKSQAASLLNPPEDNGPKGMPLPPKEPFQ